MKKSELVQTFREGCTGWLRRPVIRALSKSTRLPDRGIVCKVVDAGEFSFGLPPDAGGLPEEGMLKLAREFSEKARGFDLVLLLGGDHSGGLLLYGLPGTVCRYDEHSDSCTSPQTCGDGLVRRNDYVCAAIRGGLKDPTQIYGVGVRAGQSPYQIKPFADTCSIMDVDVDVLSQSWKIKSDYDKGTLSPDDLVGAIRRNAPAALGFFEAIEGDGLAAELACRLSLEAAAAAGKRRTGGAKR